MCLLVEDDLMKYSLGVKVGGIILVKREWNDETRNTK